MNGYATILAGKNVDVFQNCLTDIVKTIVNSACNTWSKIDWSLFNQDGRGHKYESQDRMNKEKKKKWQIVYFVYQFVWSES